MTTKFDIGQEVFYTTGCGIRNGKVTEIMIREESITYTIMRSCIEVKRSEDTIAATKEELIAKL